MKNYYQVRLGKGSKHAEECRTTNFIGVDYGIRQDLTGRLPDEWRDFNEEFIPIFLENRPDKTKVAAGLACGAIWTVSKGINIGDIVICPVSDGKYLVGEVTGGYMYQENGNLPHRRPVQWLNTIIERVDMSEALRGSTGTPNTVTNLTRYSDEIEQVLDGVSISKIFTTDETIEDPIAFAMEKHLEDFLVQNWSQTPLANDYEIYEEDGELIGQQYPTDTGPMDILAVSKDQKTLLVVELKKGRASDVVVGQIMRYMGFVQDELAETGQQVKGVVIALNEDKRLRRALSVAPNVDFYRYQISFQLIKSELD